MKTERTIRIISEDLYVSADFGKRAGRVVRKTANDAQLADLRDRIRSGEDLANEDYLDLVAVEELAVGDEEPLKAQIDDFLDAVRTNHRPEVDARAGLAAVTTAERIVEAARAMGSRQI
jgi:predicted dehydrogenase